MGAGLAFGSAMDGLSRGISMVGQLSRLKDTGEANRQKSKTIKYGQAVALMESTGDTRGVTQFYNEYQRLSGLTPEDPSWIQKIDFDPETKNITTYMSRDGGTKLAIPESSWRPVLTGEPASKKASGIPSEVDPKVDPRSDPANPINKERSQTAIRGYLDKYFDISASDPAAVAKAINAWEWNQDRGAFEDPTVIAEVYPGLKPRPVPLSQHNLRKQRGLTLEDPLPNQNGRDAVPEPVRSSRGIPSETAIPTPQPDRSGSTRPQAAMSGTIAKLAEKYQKAQAALASDNPATKAKATAFLESKEGIRMKQILLEAGAIED